MNESKEMGYDLKDLKYRFVGLNHFHWHRVWDKNGKEITKEIINKCYKGEKTAATPANIHDTKFLPEQLDEMEMIPCAYHRYYYRYDDMLKFCLEDYNTIGTRGEQVKKLDGIIADLQRIRKTLIRELKDDVNYKVEENTDE